MTDVQLTLNSVTARWLKSKRSSLVSLATHPLLVLPVLRVANRLITRFLLQQAWLKAERADSGAVTLIRRFASATNLNIHRHCLPEGYSFLADGNAVSEDSRALRPLQAAACTYRISSARVPDRRISQSKATVPLDTAFTQSLCAGEQRFRVHAAVRCRDEERQRLQQLCPYIRRQALASERVQCKATPGRWCSGSRLRGAMAPPAS